MASMLIRACMGVNFAAGSRGRPLNPGAALAIRRRRYTEVCRDQAEAGQRTSILPAIRMSRADIERRSDGTIMKATSMTRRVETDEIRFSDRVPADNNRASRRAWERSEP